MKYTEEECQNASAYLTSVIIRCEKMLLKFKEETSQYTLLKNRIFALQVSKSLLDHNERCFTKVELERALPPILSILHKCKTAQKKYEMDSQQYHRFDKQIKAMILARDCINDQKR